MNRKYTQASLAVVGVLALVGGGTALASKGRGGGQLKTGVVGHRLHGPGQMLDTAASYLGTTAGALMTQLRSGKTLADVASATSGKSVQGLVDALVAAEKQNLADAVSAGRLTQAQADAIAQGLTLRTTDFVNGNLRMHGPGRGGPGFGMHGPGFGMHGPGDEIQAAADYLGTTASSLLAQLRNGKTLADVASATSGKSTSGLVAALVAHEKAELADAVKAGRLTQAQADEVAATLSDRFTRLVNGAGMHPGMMRPHDGPGFFGHGFFGHGRRA